MTDASLRKARILIVDDQIANISLLENILRRIGYTFLRGVTDSRNAVAEVAEFAPDLILLDLNMPNVDGFAIMKQLAEVTARETFLPVLVLTADATAATKRKALATGATDFLHKPFDSSEIFMRIGNLLDRRFLHVAMELQITERTRELEAALLELKAGQRHAVQQERLHAFAEMAGGVCHDFNNALMSVIGYSDLLLQDPAMLDDRETTLDYLKTMNTAGRDAAQVIGRLRDFYRPREQIDVFESLNLNVVIEQAVALTQPKWKNQPLAGNQTVSIELDLQKVPSVSGNAAELREVLTNLLFNAVDAMPGGGVITLRTHRAGDDAVLEIIDTGCGMSEEVRVRCLEPFFSTKGERGTGLGLPMVFGIIKRHEGQLEIESEIGSGTTFRICLPGQVRTFAQAEITPDQITRPLNVLVVDDDPVCRDVVGKYLTADGHGVVFAANGTQAMENLKTESFDLLITDYAIPGFNGVEIAEALRILGGTQPVLLLTGFDDVALPGKTDVVDMMLVKPLSQNDLRRALKTLMDRDATYTTSHAKDPRVPISYSLEAL